MSAPSLTTAFTPRRPRPPQDPAPSLAALARDMRNPLSAIRNAAALLTLNSGDAATGKKVMSLLDRQVAYLASMVDLLAEMARATPGVRCRRCRMIDEA